MIKFARSKRYGILGTVSSTGYFAASRWVLGRTYTHGTLLLLIKTVYSSCLSTTFSKNYVVRNTRKDLIINFNPVNQLLFSILMIKTLFRVRV